MLDEEDYMFDFSTRVFCGIMTFVGLFFGLLDEHILLVSVLVFASYGAVIMTIICEDFVSITGKPRAFILGMFWGTEWSVVMIAWLTTLVGISDILKWIGG